VIFFLNQITSRVSVDFFQKQPKSQFRSTHKSGAKFDGHFKEAGCFEHANELKKLLKLGASSVTASISEGAKFVFAWQKPQHCYEYSTAALFCTAFQPGTHNWLKNAMPHQPLLGSSPLLSLEAAEALRILLENLICLRSRAAKTDIIDYRLNYLILMQ